MQLTAPFRTDASAGRQCTFDSSLAKVCAAGRKSFSRSKCRRREDKVQQPFVSNYFGKGTASFLANLCLASRYQSFIYLLPQVGSISISSYRTEPQPFTESSNIGINPCLNAWSVKSIRPTFISRTLTISTLLLLTALCLTAHPILAFPSLAPALTPRQNPLEIAFYPNADCDRGNEGDTPTWFDITTTKCTPITGALSFTPLYLQFTGQAPCTIELYEDVKCTVKGDTATIQSQEGMPQPGPGFVPGAYVSSCA